MPKSLRTLLEVPDMWIALILFFFLFAMWALFRQDWIKDQGILILGLIVGALRAHLVQPGRATDPGNEEGK